MRKQRTGYLRAVSLVIAVMMLSGTLGLSLGACEKSRDEPDKTGAAASTATSAVKPTVTKTLTATAAKTTSISSQVKQETAPAITAQPEVSEETEVAEEEVTTAEKFKTEITDSLGLGEMNIDLGGKAIRLISWGTTTIPVPERREASASNVVWYSKIEAAEKKYNFKLDFERSHTSGSQLMNDLINNTLAGIRITDLLHVDGSQIVQYAAKGILSPLDNYLDYNLPIIKINPVLTSGTEWRGKHYGIRLGTLLKNASVVLSYNMALTEAAGLPDILDLVDKKQWNWDAFLDYARKMTKDINGDGIIDQWGVCSRNDFLFVNNILISNGTTGADFVDDKLVYALNKAPAMRALNFAVQLAFVERVYFNTDAPYKKGLAGLLVHDSLSNLVPIIVSGVPSYLAPLPMGPDVDDYQNVGRVASYGLSALADNPKEVTRIWFEICHMWDENGNDIPELKEAQEKFLPESWAWDPANTSTRYYMRERDYLVQNYLGANYKGKSYIDVVPGLTSLVTSKAITPLFKGETTAAGAVAAIEFEMQNILDQY